MSRYQPENMQQVIQEIERSATQSKHYKDRVRLLAIMRGIGLGSVVFLVGAVVFTGAGAVTAAAAVLGAMVGMRTLNSVDSRPSYYLPKWTSEKKRVLSVAAIACVALSGSSFVESEIFKMDKTHPLVESFTAAQKQPAVRAAGRGAAVTAPESRI